VWQSFK